MMYVIISFLREDGKYKILPKTGRNLCPKTEAPEDKRCLCCFESLFYMVINKVDGEA